MTPTNPDSLDLPDVAVLCGGLGTRLRAAVADRPKALAVVAGRPFLAWLLDLLALQGFHRVVLCTGYQAEQIKAEFGENYKSLQLHYSPEPSLVGTGGAVRHALPLLRSPDVLLINGDSYCGVDLKRFCRDHKDAWAAASMVLTHVADSTRFGTVQLNEQGRVSAFREKSSSAGPGWINAGIYLANRALIEAIPSNVVCSLEREIFPLWIERGLRGVKSEGPFIDIGTPESYAKANALFRHLITTSRSSPEVQHTPTEVVS